MEYEITVKTKIGTYGYSVTCDFWFKSPFTGNECLVSKHKKKDESNMKFVERMKAFMKSKDIINDVKLKIQDDSEKEGNQDKLKKDLKEIKKELHGITFNVKVDLK